VTVPIRIGVETLRTRDRDSLSDLYDHGRLGGYIGVPTKPLQLEIVEGVEGGLDPVTRLVRDESLLAQSVHGIL
jgi:hypothetical protein